MSKAARSAVPSVAGRLTPTPAATARRPATGAPAPAAVVGARCEFLESRTFLSAAPLDVTNSYGGVVTFKAGKVKVKEAITVTVAVQQANGFVTGQVDSDHLGTVNVVGKLKGKTLKLVTGTGGGTLTAKIGSKGTALSGSVTNAVDNTTGKFKVKASADAPAIGALSAASGPRARPLASTGPATGSGGLDPSIDPTSGLPIDPVTGLPIDPSVTPGDDGLTPGGTPVIDPVTGGTGGGTVTPTATAPPGTLIGANRSILGIWVGTFNFDNSAAVFDPADPDSTTAVNGTEPGTDTRVVTFTTPNQDATGLVSGTLDIERFGTFNFTGFVTDAHIDLALSGSSPGAGTGVVSLDLDPTSGFATFNGTIDATSNGLRAAVVGPPVTPGPITATFVSNVPNPPLPLPAGEELYSVAQTEPDGDPTIGNYDPQGSSIGMDFSVGLFPLTINSLGTFDSLGDGLSTTIRVAIYDTASPGSPVIVADITNDNSSLSATSQYRYLTTFTPITLQTGVYRLMAFGYTGDDLAGDVGDDSYQGPVPVSNNGTLGSVQFPISNSLNANNYISNPGGAGGGGGGGGGGTGGTLTYPRLELGLPLNRFLAGSMLFVESDVPVTPTPTPTTPTPTTTIVKPVNSAFPGGVLTTTTGPEVFGSQSGGIIP